VISALARQGLLAEFAGVRSAGDLDPDPAALGRGDGVFVTALEVALRQGRVDLAVHSLKDMPVRLADDLEIVAVLARHDPRDAVVGVPLNELARGARVGTSSPRRAAFVHAVRPDLRVVPIRGNVPRRVGYVESGEMAAVILALAGLERLGLGARVAEVLPLDTFPPAPGQGAIAVEARRGALSPAVAALDDLPSRRTTTAERDLLDALGGTCAQPLGAHAEILADGRLRLRASLALGDAVRFAEASGNDDRRVVGRVAASLGRT
jgi:hydroxymethylbilane synthase